MGLCKKVKNDEEACTSGRIPEHRNQNNRVIWRCSLYRRLTCNLPGSQIRTYLTPHLRTTKLSLNPTHSSFPTNRVFTPHDMAVLRFTDIRPRMRSPSSQRRNFSSSHCKAKTIRQLIKLLCSRIPVDFDFHVTRCLFSVSYTHLDVYKRQV